MACLATILSTCVLANAGPAAAEKEDIKAEASARTARNVFLPYYNNGAYYNPWNYNYNHYQPYRHHFNPYSPYHHPIAAPATVSRIPIAGNPNDFQSPILASNDVRHPDGSYYFE